jgi:hypothetical protein
MCGIGISAPRSVALGDTTPTPVSSGAVCLVVSGLLLLGSPDFLSYPSSERGKPKLPYVSHPDILISECEPFFSQET